MNTNTIEGKILRFNNDGDIEEASTQHMEYLSGETEFKVDFSSSRGGAVYVSGIVKEPVDKNDLNMGYKEVEKKFLTKTTVVPQMLVEGEASIENVSIDIRQRKNDIHGHHSSIFTRDTVLFIQRPLLRDKVAEYFDRHTEINDVIVLSSIRGDIIGASPSNIRGMIDGNIIEKKSIGRIDVNQETHDKEELKAYETPSEVFDVFLSSIDKAAFKDFILYKVADKVSRILVANKKTAESIYIELNSNNLLYIKPHIEGMFLDTFHHLGDTSLPELSNVAMTAIEADSAQKMVDIIMEREKIPEIMTFIEKLFKEGMDGEGFMLSLSRHSKDFKDILGFAPITAPIPIFDPQAGSAKGLLGGIDNSNFNGRVKGLELRENIEYEDERLNILGGVNTTIYRPVIEEVFYNGTTTESAINMLSYLNPPYTASDSIARETVEMFKNNMLITGLFPTKMKKFLNNNLSKESLILEIPKEVTGYTDEKAPDRFLFVIGVKNSFESHQATLDREGTRGTVLSDAYKPQEPFNRNMPDELTKKEFSKAIDIFLEGRGSPIKHRYYKSFVYFNESARREDMVISKMHTGITEQKEILDNAEILNEVLEREKSKVKEFFMPIEIAKKQKVFIDPRFYSQEGIYERYRFEEVAQNIPLLNYYRDKMPSIFELVVKIAEEKEIEIPIDTTPQPEFKMNEKVIKKKEAVTNLSLGMMRLKYYPSNISLVSQENKDILSDVLKRAFKGRLSEKAEGMQKEAIMLSDRLVIKSERITRTTVENTERMPKEVLVMLDKYGNDVCKVDLELDAFYEELESSGIFNIEDHVELAILQTDKKRSVIKGFIREMQSPIHTIAKHNGMTREEADGYITTQGMVILKKLAKKELTTDEFNREILNFSEEYKLKSLFEKMFKIDKDALLKKLKVAASTSLSSLKKATTDSLAKQLVGFFEANPIGFYEDDKDKTFETLEGHLESRYRDKQQLASDMVDFNAMVTEELTPYYKIQTNITTSYSRLAEMLIYRYSSLKNTYSDELDDEIVDALYKNHINGMLLKSAGLMPHQVAEAEGFLALSGDKSIKHLYAEARSGKTRLFIALLMLLGLHKDEDITLVLETANIPDITEQMMESFPFMAMRAKFFGDPKKIATSHDSSFRTLIHDNMYPVPYRLFTQSKVRGGGEASARLNTEMSKNMKEVTKVLRNKYGNEVTREKLLRDYPNSKFKELLTFACEE